MRYGDSIYVYAFWIVIGLLVLMVYRRIGRKKRLSRFAHEEVIKSIYPSGASRAWLLKEVLVLCSFIFLVIALMRPQWGYSWQKVMHQGVDIMVVIDTSRSMLASDVKPNRLTRSKLAVKDLLARLTGDRVGLVAFAGTSFLQCPLTVDYDGFSLALGALDTTIIPEGGTSLGEAIRTALRSFEKGESKYQAMVLITDGEDHSQTALDEARQAHARGIRIFCVGIGTTQGELIEVKDEAGAARFLKDKEGNVVKSRLNEELLKNIAATTQGAYIRATGTQFGLERIYDEYINRMEKKEFESRFEKTYHERYQIPLGFALLMLCIEPFIHERKRNGGRP